MKVLHLISGGDTGGAKTHVFALLNALVEDIDVTIACFMDGVFYQELQSMPIKSVLIEQKFRNDLTVVSRLQKLIKKERFNLVHVHGARANFIAMILKKFIGIPVITTVHSDYLLDFTQNLYKKIIFTQLNAFSLRFMDYYIAVSDNFKQMLVERKFPEDKIYTVYNAINFKQEIAIEDKEVFLQKHNVDYKGKTLVGIIGRFDKVKGHDIFIKACNEVLKENKDVLFLLAGIGDEQENLEAMCEEFGIKDNVIFLGFIKDIYSFINAIDVNVLSSYSESFPYVLLEGAFMKKATVSTAVGGIPDLIIDGETGHLAEPANENDLAKQILKMVNDEEHRLKLGNNLYDFAKSNFSTENLKNTHIQIYNSVLKREKDKDNLFDIVLSGYYGFNNSGDEAILDTIITRIREVKEDAKILVLSKKPNVTQANYDVTAVNRYNLFKINKLIKRSRVFVNGGGSLIQDITSTQSLIYYTALMNLANKYGLKTMLYSNGIGPIRKPWNRKRSKKALNKCDYITLRDPESLEELKRLGVEGVPIELSADPTLSTLRASSERINEIFQEEELDLKAKYFGISFRQWKYNDPNFVTKMADTIKQISEKYDIIPLFIPMHFPNDLVIGQEIMNKSGVKCVTLKHEYAVKELIGIIHRTDFVISMRLHTLIYSANVNIPVIGIVYDPKIQSFLDYINQDKYVDTDNIDVDLILEMVEDIEANRPAIRYDLGQEVLELKKLCYEDPKIVISLLD